MEIMFMEALYLPKLMQIRKFIVSPEDWVIWGGLNDYEEGKETSCFPSGFSEYGYRPIIKADTLRFQLVTNDN